MVLAKASEQVRAHGARFLDEPSGRAERMVNN